MIPIAAAALMGYAFAGGCGEEGPAALADEDTYCVELARATCGWATSCCELSELQTIIGVFGLDPTDPYSIELLRQAQQDQSKCRDMLHSACVTTNRDLLESIRTERVTMDRVVLEECVAEFTRAAEECDVGLGIGPTVQDACDPREIFTGNAEDTDPCFHELDCAPDLFCWRGGGGDAGAGLCRPVIERGGACRDSTRCDDTSACVPFDTRTQACEPLDRQPDGTFCTADALCLPGSFCNTLEFACEPKRWGGLECNRSEHCLSARCNRDIRQCEPQVGAGERCASQAACQDALWCDPVYAANYCTLPLETADAGDACDATVLCGPGLVCVNAICQAHLIEGQLCTVDEQCNLATYCDDTTSECTAPRKAAGTPCTSSRECFTGLYCSAVDGLTCQPRIPPGGACVPGTGSCAENTRCDPFTSTCSPLLLEGDSCGTNDDCTTGLLCEGFAGRCQPRLGRAELCDASAACADADYCDPSGAMSACRMRVVVGDGQSCVSASVACDTGLYCGPDGLCHALGSAGDACMADTECNDPLYCDPGTFTCTAPGGQDDPCMADAHCQDDFYCNTLFLQCWAEAMLGDMCSTSPADTDPICGDELDCQFEPVAGVNECVSDPLEGPGGPCTTSADCEPDLRCDTSSFTCASRGGPGDPCVFPDDCEMGTTCDPMTNTCVDQVGVGGECFSTTGCEPGLICHPFAGSCTERRAPGTPCLLSEECPVDFECLLDAACVPLAKTGEECDAELPCAEGRRCDDEFGLCVKLEDPLPSGERCHAGQECLSGTCIDHLCTGACQGVGE